MNFGGWVPLQDAPGAAPDKPGVLQVRADAVLAYPRGKSAMVWYACGRANQGLRGYVAERGALGIDRAAALGGRWIRFGESEAPAVDCARLLRQFVERFGASPAANSDPDSNDNDKEQEARSFDG